MADNTSFIDLISSSQAQKEVTANDAFNSASPALFGARRSTTSSGLTWGFYGGRYKGSTVANGTLSLTASATNYIVALKSTGEISFSTATTNWNDQSEYIRLYSVVTSSTSVSSWQDHRQIYDQEDYERVNYQTVGSPSTYTLAVADLGSIIEIDNSAGIDLILPNNLQQGFHCKVVQVGSGQIKFTPAVGSVMYNRQSHTRTAGQFAVAELYITRNIASPTMTNAEYILSGDTTS